MSKAWGAGSTRRWRAVRAYVLQRDARWGCRAHAEGWCERSGAGSHRCTGRGEVGHHTRGRAVTGDDPAHVVASCAVCNGAIGEPTTIIDRPIVGVTKWS